MSHRHVRWILLNVLAAASVQCSGASSPHDAAAQPDVQAGTDVVMADTRTGGDGAGIDTGGALDGALLDAGLDATATRDGGSPEAGRDAATAPDADTSKPIGDLTGWHEVFSEDFNTPAATGAFPGTTYGAKFDVYPDGWTDNSHHVTYMGSRTLSVHDGVLDIDAHTEGTTRMCAAFLLRAPAQTYGRYSFRFRADPVPDYGAVFLLWPDDNMWPVHGEMDFPEGALAGAFGAHAHYANPDGGQQSFEPLGTWPAWHIATLEWSPDREVYILDGATVGTSTHQVPSTPMHQVFQCGSAVGALPSATATGHVLIDWMVIYTRTG